MAESLEGGITCPLCLELYQDPKILPCGHIYCRDPCLTGLARQRRDRTISCPECRQIAQIPQGDVSTFPTVYRIASLVDSHKTKKKGTDQPDCLSARTETCQIHEGQELALYCETCSKTLCRDCIITAQEHRDHAYSYIKDIIDKSRRTLLAKRKQAQSVNERLEHALDIVKSAKERVSTQRGIISRKIDTQVVQVVEKLEEQKAALHSQVDRISNSKLTSLHAQYLKLTQVQSGLHQSTQAMQNGVENMSDVEFMSEMKQLQANLVEKIAIASTMDLKPAVDGSMGICSDNLIATFRQFHLYSGKPADPSKCMFESEDFSEVQIDRMFKISVKVLDSSGRTCSEEQSVTAELHSISDLSIVQQGVLAKTIKPGIYLMEMVPKHRGRHMLAVKVNGRHILGSPAPLFVSVPPQKLGKPIAIIAGLRRPGGLHRWNGKIIACECSE